MIAIAQDESTAALELEPQKARPMVAQHAPSQPAARQLSVVEYAMQNGASAADVRALVELQIQMDQHKLAMMKAQDEREREQRKVAGEMAFRDAFAAFRGENITVPRSATADRGRAGSFKYAEFQAVSDLLSPALSRHGFSFSHDPVFGTKVWPLPDNPQNTIGWVTVTCYLHHRGGHTEHVMLEGPMDELSANTANQNMQATASFFKRQTLLAITGTATGGEDDESRMRKRTGSTDEPVDDEAALAMVDAGEAKAAEGLDALTKWWGTLTAKDRNHLSQSFKGWRSKAVKADQQRGAK